MKKRITSYKESKQGDITSLRVDYEMRDGSNAYNTYTFYEQYVEVKAVIENLSSDLRIAGAMLKRDMQEEYIEAEKKLATSWVPLIYKGLKVFVDTRVFLPPRALIPLFIGARRHL